MATRHPVGRPRIYVPPELIRHLKNQGLSLRQISAITGYSYGSLRRALKNLEPAGRHSAMSPSGRG